MTVSHEEMRHQRQPLYSKEKFAQRVSESYG
jgi:hypothetical protein